MPAQSLGLAGVAAAFGMMRGAPDPAPRLLPSWSSPGERSSSISGHDRRMEASTDPRVLFIYYTFTKQALKVTEEMESVFRDHGWSCSRAQIEFTDKRYTKRFEQFPFKHPRSAVSS